MVILFNHMDRRGVSPCYNKSFKGFTLAEVLITLGIIGVVAAMTLPTLISNYQKRVYENQLKKAASVLSNGFKLMMAHDGVTELKDTYAFSGMTGTVTYLIGEPTQSCTVGDTRENINTDDCRSLRKGFEDVFSGVRFTSCDGRQMKYLNGDNYHVRSTDITCIEFADGSVIFSGVFNVSPSSSILPYQAQFWIDINGPKNPNTIGRDIFDFYVGKDGIARGRGSNSDNENKSWRSDNSDHNCVPFGRGLGCAGRVLEEDAMNY